MKKNKGWFNSGMEHTGEWAWESDYFLNLFFLKRDFFKNNKENIGHRGIRKNFMLLLC